MKLQDFVQDKPILVTEQLILRPLRKEDVADLKEWLGDSSVYRYWGKRRRNLRKVFIGVLSTNKIIKLLAICGYISLRMTAWQKWHFAFHLPIKVIDL